MAAKRLVLLLGILCVMGAMSGDIWITNQDALLASGSVATSSLQEAHSAVLRANLPMYRTTAAALKYSGWIMIAGSLIMIVVEAAQPRKRKR